MESISQIGPGVFTPGYFLEFYNLCMLDSFFHWQLSFSASFACSIKVNHAPSRSTHCWLPK